MKIDFFDLLVAENWEPAEFDRASRHQLWEDGGSLADAGVDLAATLDGAVSRSTRIDPDFTMGGIRVRPDFRVPAYSTNLRELIIVMGGGVTVEWGEDGETHTLGPGDFWISDAGTKHSLTAGPEGVSYLETWPVWVQLITTWYDGPGWVRR